MAANLLRCALSGVALAAFCSSAAAQWPAAIEGESKSTEPKTLRWDNRDYEAAQAVAVLMEAASEGSDAERAQALDLLGRIPLQFKGTAQIDRLIEMYGRTQSRDERVGVVLCLWKSHDPRGIALFEKALKTEDDVIRLFGAGGLAQWNVRAGVAALVDLLVSDNVLPSGQRISDEALKLLQGNNRRKGWGFPEKELTNPILLREDLKPGEKVRLVAPIYKVWFEENQDRFPEWRSGDPLPDVTDQDD